jgi:type IV secretion system protein VirB10
VFDSIRGAHLLVPQGARLFLEYNTERQAADTRLQLTAKTLYFPDGSSLALGGMPSLDDKGAAGVEGRVNRHVFQRYGTAAILSLITGGISLATHRRGGYSHYEPSDAALYGVGNVMGRAVGEDLYRGMNTRPTLTIPAGYRFHLQFAKDYAFPAPYPFAHAANTEP